MGKWATTKDRIMRVSDIFKDRVGKENETSKQQNN